MIDIIKPTVNLETLTTLASMFKFKIHGDVSFDKWITHWDLEFENMIDAASFAQIMGIWGYTIDIRFNDSVHSLHLPVVLTLVVFKKG